MPWQRCLLVVKNKTLMVLSIVYLQFTQKKVLLSGAFTFMFNSHKKKKSDKCDPKPIWVHAWKVNHGGDFLNTTI